MSNNWVDELVKGDLIYCKEALDFRSRAENRLIELTPGRSVMVLSVVQNPDKTRLGVKIWVNDTAVAFTRSRNEFENEFALAAKLKDSV